LMDFLESKTIKLESIDTAFMWAHIYTWNGSAEKSISKIWNLMQHPGIVVAGRELCQMFSWLKLCY
jgi:hypothetical protein